MADNVFDKAAFCYVGSVNGWFDRCLFVFAMSRNVAPCDAKPGRRALVTMANISRFCARPRDFCVFVKGT